MALDRTWYNSLVDDDGSGTVGSIWRKQDVGTLMNTVDQELARLDTTVHTNVVQDVSGISGVVNDLELLPHTQLLIIRNTLPLTITGLKGGAPGQTITILAASSAPVFLTHLDPRSQVANWLGTSVTSGPTPLAPYFGRAVFIYDNQPEGVFWRMVSHAQGQSLQAPFNPAHFTTNGGPWTIAPTSVGDLAYTVVGKTIAINYWILFDGGSILTTPAPTVLTLTLPLGYVLTRTQATPSIFYVDSGGGQGIALAYTTPGTSQVKMQKNFSPTAWPLGSFGFIMASFFEIN